MRVLLAGNQVHDRDRGRKAALRAGLECSATDCVPLADLRLRLAREPGVQLVVVFWDGEPDAAARAVKAAAEQTRQPIYAVASPDPDARESAAAAGVAGVWELERVQEELMETADRMRRAGRVPDTRGRFVVVTAAQGGTGVTTVATGLAFALANPGGVALAELGTGTPSLALNLNLQPPHSLADLIRASERVDASMVRNAVARHPAGVDVLAYTQEALTPEAIPAEAARDFQVLLRSAFAWSVVDGGHRVGPGNEHLFAHADAVVLVTRLDPPSLRLTRRQLAALADRGVAPDAVSVVANRYGQSNLVPWAKAEESLRTKVAAWLPDDSAAVNKALRDGRPLAEVAKWAKLTRELGKLAAAVQAKLSPTR